MGVKCPKVSTRSAAIVGLVACFALLTCGSSLAAPQLPDGRAWEMISPLNKNGGDIIGIGGYGGGGIVQDSADGSAVTYLSQNSFPEPKPVGAAVNQYLSRRQMGGWSTQSITTPSNAGTYGVAGTGAPYKAFSSSLSLGLLLSSEEGGEHASGNPPLPPRPGLEPEGPPGYQNFYLRSPVDGSLTTLMTFIPNRTAKDFYMHFQGASRDLNSVVVSSDAALTPGATVEGTRSNLFEWSHGEWSAVNVLPEASGGATATNAELGSGQGESNMVSDDGTHVYWRYGAGGSEALYLREDATRTIQIDAPEAGIILGEHEVPRPRFQAASADGREAFFISGAPLTRNANTGPPCVGCARAGVDLYKFDTSTRTLTDVSADAAAENGAEVQGTLGVSEDGSYVFFVARGALPGAVTEGSSPVAGEDDLYMWHDDPVTHLMSTRFIGTLAPSDQSDWSREVLTRTARVSQGGQVVLMSHNRLTGYDNRDANNPSVSDDEVFLYDPGLKQLRCVSCNPSGARPIGSSSIPGGTPFEHLESGGAIYQSRVLTEDGHRAFFDSSDTLVSQDTNGVQDVYEYENGRVYMLSGGTSASPSEFVDASVTGNDIFFLTRQQLVRGDTDQLVDLYDARVGGGIPESPPPSQCENEGCRPPISSVVDTLALSSTSFSGVGNLVPVASKPAAKPKTPKKKRKVKRRAKGRKAARSGGGKVAKRLLKGSGR